MNVTAPPHLTCRTDYTPPTRNAKRANEELLEIVQHLEYARDSLGWPDTARLSEIEDETGATLARLQRSATALTELEHADLKWTIGQVRRIRTLDDAQRRMVADFDAAGLPIAPWLRTPARTADDNFDELPAVPARAQ